jgi:hypothetical protein
MPITDLRRFGRQVGTFRRLARADGCAAVARGITDRARGRGRGAMTIERGIWRFD